ncbi:hypothetical protein GCM10027413_30530 [Conyzicola nivalis]|uniref:FtsX-like permease family protein n=1 Tax=Conyzicola nivalis TaxID=1477021 RepID=A0A916WLY1_9MICO|nr:hypothetical protein [Conyzicola nivalis]GGB12803.1 hypothetical protein GCM10010979_28980 [Conyzicola nivalis]
MSAPDTRRRPASGRTRRNTSLRSLVGATALLVRRRASRDAPLLVGWIALLCLATVLAVAVPRLVLDAVDRGAREAVAEAGPTADIIVRAQVGDPNVASDFATLPAIVDLAATVPGNLPDGLARVTDTPTVSAISPGVRMTRAEAVAGAARIEAQFGLLGPDQQSGLTLVDGRLPAGTGDGDRVEVVVSSEAADVAALAVGTVLNASVPVADPDEPPTVVAAEVVGIVASAHPSSATVCASEWCDLPTMWAPEVDKSRLGGSGVELTLLVDAEGIAVAQQLFFDPFVASVRLPLRAERFSGELVTTVIAETDALEANAAPLTAGSGVTVNVRTDFADALRGYGDRAAAAVAQMTLMIAGLFGAVAAVMLVVGGLIVRRRSADLALERARGSSLGGVAVGGLAESLVLAVVGAGLGLGIAALVTPGPLADPLPLAAVGVVAVLALPVRAMLLAREAWSGRRQPANRRDRQQLVARSRIRRLVLELSVILLAVAALASLRSRGLVAARTDGTDPLLAAAPLLLAAAVTLVVLRVQPPVVRGIGAVAARSRGAVGVLAAAHATRAVAVLPLLALTIAVALVVGGSLLVQTVREGQVDASWQRIGADARATGVFGAGVAEGVRAAPGVSAASAQLVTRAVGFDSGAASTQGTLIAVDPGFADVARLLPARLAPDSAALDDLATASADFEALPVLVDERLAARVDIDELVMVFGEDRVPVRVVATFEGGPGGYLSGPIAYADLGALGERLGKLPPADTLLVMGDGAAAAAASTDATELVTRARWLADRRDQELVQGVERMTQLSVAAVALLAAVALVTTVAGGGRSRSRSLSLLRTLGVRRGFGWVLALAELAPLVVAALVGGAAAGVAIFVASGPALGLRILTGGTGDPVLRVDPATVVLVVAGSVVLCAIAIVADVVAHRRDRPGEVLRVGETT